jgi:hypothetical protein
MVVTRAKKKSSVKALGGRLKADRKKVIIAVVLICVMVIMWLRVFAKKGPGPVKAAVVSSGRTGGNLTASGNVRRGSNVVFTELPVVTGRNDVLTRDFFAVRSWREFVSGRKEGSGSTAAVNKLTNDGKKMSFKNITSRLNLEAIELGSAPRIFINDNFVGVGDKFFIDDGVESIECEVVQVRADAVLVRCGETEVTLKLSDVK